MDVLSYSTFRQSLASVLDKVNEDSVPIQITRKGNKGAVVMSVEDYEQLEETLYVLQNKSLSAQIDKSIQTHEAGKGRKA
ncbi:MAG: type II toxin-antitoxin system Phd/YefM family antitoxin, partial [Cocleimonas sp.]|nr:type II toxin-antitoxin system Phd/YefM family antitoxin [Cocleimonas sp.]